MGAGGVYLADQMVLAPGRALQRQLAQRDTKIRALTERNQALEAAVRLLRQTERRARLVVLDQGPGPEGHVRTRVPSFAKTASDSLVCVRRPGRQGVWRD